MKQKQAQEKFNERDEDPCEDWVGVDRSMCMVEARDRDHFGRASQTVEVHIMYTIMEAWGTC